MTILLLITYAVIGACAGLLAGLLGIGGGLVTVPVLLLVFNGQNFPNAHSMHQAIGTALAAMVFTAGSSAWAHYVQKGVYWKEFRSLTPGIVLGSILGALVADELSSYILKFIFGACQCLIGLFYLLCNTPQVNPLAKKQVQITFSSTLYFITAVGIGTLSTILGIGGGLATVPFLTSLGVPLRNAISTSAVTGFIIALVGALSFFFLGLIETTSQQSGGYVNIPAFIIIGITSGILAQYGAKLAYILPISVLKKIFGLFLIIAGMFMIFKTLF